VHVDYQTQKRTLKDSAFWYRDVIRANGANVPDASSSAVAGKSEA
jgi:beta-glucosidase